MTPEKLEPLPRYYSIGPEEAANVADAMDRGLSGYLGGIDRGGYWIERLSAVWCSVFNCHHAIPCNSATSGLLAACMAAEIGPGDEVWVADYSMSASASCAMVLGAKVKFIDIEPQYLAMRPLALLVPANRPKAIIVVNLHGHPAQLAQIKSWADRNGVVMIEDNAQSPLAMEGNQYAGTVGHMGVFSLNVHKHIQAGEGGVVVTNSFHLSEALRDAINHGELARRGDQERNKPGLNLRMTEPTAAIACAQLSKIYDLVNSRAILADRLNAMTRDIPMLVNPMVRSSCSHSYYVWAPRMAGGYDRQRFVDLLQSKNFPIHAGYSKPLHRVFGTEDRCPMADLVESSILTYEVCAYDPSKQHLQQMSDILHWAAEQLTLGGEYEDRGSRDR